MMCVPAGDSAVMGKDGSGWMRRRLVVRRAEDSKRIWLLPDESRGRAVRARLRVRNDMVVWCVYGPEVEIEFLKLAAKNWWDG